MTMAEIRFSHGQIKSRLTFDSTMKFDHKINKLTINHGADSRMSIVLGHGLIFWPLTMGQIPGFVWSCLATQKTVKIRKKPVPNLKFAVAFGFFRYFSVFCGTFSVFSVWTSTRNSSHSKIMSTMRSWEAKNCLITHLMPKKPCKCLIRAIITNKNHLTRTR